MMKHMKRRLTPLLSAFLYAALSVLPGVCFHARAQESGGFSIHAVIPDNQIDKKQTYFDLRVNPGHEQTVKVIITNSRDKELTAQVTLNAASTGRNGLLVYTVPDIRDELMTVSINDVTKLNTASVTVPAHGTGEVEINIKMPSEPVAGVLLGGIAVSESEPQEVYENTGGVSLNNKITYVIALKLTGDGGEEPADFDLADIRPELINFKPAVVAYLKNKSARIVKDMKVTARVYRKNSDTVLHELLAENSEMAPLSAGAFVIGWGNRPIAQGGYRLLMTAEYEGRTWQWEEEFTVGEQAGEINAGAVGLVRNYTWLYVFIGAASMALVWYFSHRLGKRGKPQKTGQA